MIRFRQSSGGWMALHAGESAGFRNYGHGLHPEEAGRIQNQSNPEKIRV